MVAEVRNLYQGVASGRILVVDNFPVASFTCEPVECFLDVVSVSMLPRQSHPDLH